MSSLVPARKISWWRTEIGEREVARIAQSVREESISQGRVTAEFEARLSTLLDVEYVVACTSGSTALLMALLAAGVKHGDEVLVPNRTWIATAHAVMMAGARPVLVDDDPLDKTVFVEGVRRRLTSRTRAILPVHLGGRAADLDALGAIAREKGIPLVEDAAQAFLSRNRHGFLGTQSAAGCFSLSLAKLLSTGQGGFVVTRDREIYRKLTHMRNHGVEDPIEVVYSQFGFNFRFNDILSSIGVTQLDTMEGRLRHLEAIYRAYEQGLQGIHGIRFIPVDLAAGEVPLYAEVLADDRPALVAYLASHGVQVRPYYPNLNLAPQMADPSPFPHSAIYGARGLFLPCGPSQPLENVERVIALLKNFRG